MNGDKKNHEWRTEHLMHRIRAALDNTSLLEETLTRHNAALYNRDLSLAICAGQARHEGQIAALRWLIDFVGINAAEDLHPKRPPEWRTTSEDLGKFGAHELIPIPSDDATFLAKIWKACSQATGHPTSGTNHEPLTEPNRRRAMEIILGHLQSTIYKAADDDWNNYMKIIALEQLPDGRANIKVLRQK